MGDPIVFVGTHRIHEGKLEIAKAASAALVQFVRENHPRVLHFEIYIDDDSRRMTAIQIHPDEASLMQHMQLAGDKLAQAYEFLDTEIVRIFGRPTESLQSAVAMMAQRERVTFEAPFASFTRLAAVAV